MSVTKYIQHFLLLILSISSLTACTQTPKAEFRGLWVATVENIDWPSKRGLDSIAQQKEFIHLLDLVVENNLNAVIVQVRPCADAFYQSPYEPYSAYLTGQQGKDPGYDPLAFMVQACHERNIQFHAWFNPYRAVQNIQTNRLAENHATRQHPDWFVTYGNQKIFDPGQPEVWSYVVKIISDVVTRYDIDGVHLDDYFYPYRMPGKVFPDTKTYMKYGNGMPKADWRRHNVDTVVHLLHDAIKSIKPNIAFGISPFGVWRNKSIDSTGSNTRAGQTNYDDLYADILLWLKQGWIDYAAPQLYWETGNRLCDFETLAQWWSEHSYGKNIYIGHATYRIGEKIPAWASSLEIAKQIDIGRKYSNIHGNIFYNASSFKKNPKGLYNILLSKYPEPASVPAVQIRVESPDDAMIKIIKRQLQKEE
jgi:uncharacterized lipoprotein YddW (UPF0748 family)